MLAVTLTARSDFSNFVLFYFIFVFRFTEGSLNLFNKLLDINPRTVRVFV